MHIERLGGRRAAGAADPEALYQGLTISSATT